MKRISLLISAIFIISCSLSAQDYVDDINLSNNIANSYLDQDQEPNYSQLNKSTIAKGDITLDSIRYTQVVDIDTFFCVGSISYTAENRLNNIKWDRINYAGRSNYKTIEYTYTASGKISTKYTYNYSFQWVKTAGEEYFYDDKDSLISHKQYRYFSDDGYKIWYEYKYIYDSFGNLTEEHREHWYYGLYPYSSYYKEIYSYNQNNLLETDSTFYLNDTIWRGYKAETHFYQNQIETHLMSYYNNGGWIESYKIVNNYNQMNLIDSNYSYLKSDQGNWELGYKNYYNYTTSGKPLTSKYMEIKNDGTDLPTSKYEWFYSSNDVLYKLNYFKYDTLTDMWILDGINGSILDSNENILLKYNCNSNISSGIWDSLVSQVSLYDYNINTKNTIFPLIDKPMYSNEYINVNSNNLIKEMTEIGSSLSHIEDHYEFYYSGIPAGYQELSNENTSNLYPNPAEDQITIELDKRIDNCEIIIYNVLGQIMIKQKLNGSTKYSFDISNLNSGMYFYSIIEKGKVVESNKFIKE